MGLPNFMVIGAGKSGTTTLYEYLNEHSEVFMSPIKETNYFSLIDTQQVPREKDPDQVHNFYRSVWSWDHYVSLFPDNTDAKAIGEVSPKYLYTPRAAMRIKETIPDVKLIVILRNPVERLYSRFMHLARENRQPSDSIEDALDRDSIWWRRPDLVSEGFYYRHLMHYLKIFDRSQIKIYLFEDLKKDPKNLIKDIYEFIGVNTDFVPDFSVRYNPSGMIKSKKIDLLIGQNSIPKRIIKSLMPPIFSVLKKSKTINKRLTQLRQSNLHKPPLVKSLRQTLMKDIYQDDVIKLQTIIHRDLSEWFNPKLF